MYPVLLLLCVVSVVTGAGDEPVVTTRHGTLRGTRTSVGNGGYVDTFRKIPYAKPPTGDLRFRLPEAPDSWTGVRDATAFGPQCPQPTWPGEELQVHFPNSEDCLYLNVYTPKLQASDNRNPLPVMLWVHGGWVVGTGNTYDGTQLATKGVVIVTVNYRLTALGFLSTEDGASPGNYGLWDIIRALEWVRDSISAFYGDPDNVTIFGESAGSVLVSLLVDARAARGLFQKAIMESGCSLTFYAMTHPRLDPKPKDSARKVAESVGCDTDDTNKMVDCLRTKDAMTIVNATEKIRGMGGELQIPFQPVTETTFGLYGVFSAVPLTVLENGLFSNVSTLRGFTKDEVAKSVAAMDPDDDGFTLEEIRNGTKDLVNYFFAQSSFTVDVDRLEREIMDTYVFKPNITDPFKLRSAYLHMYDEFSVVSPTIHELQLMAKNSVKPQYLFRFSFTSPNHLPPAWAGANHADDLPYVFGSPISNVSIPGLDMINVSLGWTDEDRHVSKDVMTMWTNFAKYGEPTPDGLDEVRWLPWTPATPSYLDIDQPLRVGYTQEVITPGVDFWINTVPKILGDDNPASLIG